MSEPTATILLNGRCIGVSYKFISLYLLIDAVLICLQRTFFEQGQWLIRNSQLVKGQRISVNGVLSHTWRICIVTHTYTQA